MKDRKLSVAILGSRGIPNRYGGFEACAEELGIRLAQRGHQVSVYTSADHPVKDQRWNGVERILVKNPENRMGTFGQFLYDLYCNLDSRKKDFEVILHLGYTSDSMWYWLWDRKSAHIVNMDGQEWKRSKYSLPVRSFLKLAERLATIRSAWLVADSVIIQDYLTQHYPVPVRYIAYGANIPVSFSPEELNPYELLPNGYDLMIARMEPENNIETVIRAKIASEDHTPLIIIGNDNSYKRSLSEKYIHHEKIRFADAVYQESIVNALRHFSRLYLHGHSVGGTNPSLLEAMACECRITAHDNPFNKSVLGTDAFFFSGEKELTARFEGYDPGHFTEWVKNNLGKIRGQYNWELITDAYEQLFFDAIDNK